MAKKRKTKTPCRCRKMRLERAGKVLIRCEKHKGKPKDGWTLAFFTDEGLLRREAER